MQVPQSDISSTSAMNRVFTDTKGQKVPVLICQVFKATDGVIFQKASSFMLPTMLGKEKQKAGETTHAHCKQNSNIK